MWEYLEVVHTGPESTTVFVNGKEHPIKDFDDFYQLLNDLGTRGWELVSSSITYYPPIPELGQQYGRVFKDYNFKRRIE